MRLREQGRRLVEDRRQEPGLVRRGRAADDRGDLRRRLGQPVRCRVDVEKVRHHSRAHLAGLVIVISDHCPQPCLPQLANQVVQGIEAVYPRLVGGLDLALRIEDAGRLLAHRGGLLQVRSPRRRLVRPQPFEGERQVGSGKGPAAGILGLRPQREGSTAEVDCLLDPVTALVYRRRLEQDDGQVCHRHRKLPRLRGPLIVDDDLAHDRLSLAGRGVRIAIVPGVKGHCELVAASGLLIAVAEVVPQLAAVAQALDRPRGLGLRRARPAHDLGTDVEEQPGPAPFFASEAQQVQALCRDLIPLGRRRAEMLGEPTGLAISGLDDLRHTGVAPLVEGLVLTFELGVSYR